MSATALNGFTAATTVLKWLRAWYGENMPEAIDLDVVRRGRIEVVTAYEKTVDTEVDGLHIDDRVIRVQSRWQTNIDAG